MRGACTAASGMFPAAAAAEAATVSIIPPRRRRESERGQAATITMAPVLKGR